MKLINILKEIKIQKPNSTFIVTNKGKEICKNYNDWYVLCKKLGINDIQYESEVEDRYPILVKLIEFDIYSDIYGESIINFNEVNNIEDVKSRSSSIIGYDDEEVIKHLEEFKNEGWIKIL